MTAQKVCIFVGLEVTHAHDGGRWVPGTSQPGQALGEAVDKEVLPAVVSFGQSIDLALRKFIGQFIVSNKRQRVHLDLVVDYKLHARQAYAVDRQAPPTRSG